MFDSLQQGSTKGATQYKLKSFVTMATSGFQTPHIKGIAGHLKRSILTFANGASYVLSSKRISMFSSSLQPCLVLFGLKITNILKSSGWRLEQSGLPWAQNFYSHRCVSYRTISLPSFNGLRCKLAKIATFMYVR